MEKLNRSTPAAKKDGVPDSHISYEASVSCNPRSPIPAPKWSAAKEETKFVLDVSAIENHPEPSPPTYNLLCEHMQLDEYLCDEDEEEEEEEEDSEWEDGDNEEDEEEDDDEEEEDEEEAEEGPFDEEMSMDDFSDSDYSPPPLPDSDGLSGSDSSSSLGSVMSLDTWERFYGST